MRLTWAQRVAALSPVLVPWAAGAATLLLAREHFLVGRTLLTSGRRAASALLGNRALGAGSLRELATAAGPDAAWVLEGIEEPTDIWLAEGAWWRRVEADGVALLHAGADRRPVLGTIAVLAADAWRICAALELSARGGTPVEVFDALG